MTQYATDANNADQLVEYAVQTGTSSDGKKMGAKAVAISDGSVRNAAAVTPDNVNNLTNPAIALYVGVSGDVKVDLTGGTTITMAALAAGVWHPIRAKRVYATGTTATGILYAY